MLAIRDPAAIKLFGKTIPVLSSGDFLAPVSAEVAVVVVVGEDDGGGGSISESPDHREHSAQRSAAAEEEEHDAEKVKLNSKNIGKDSARNQKPASGENESNKTVEDSASNESQDQEDRQLAALKKPNNILPCPRCNSMETKFCYYNNYNLNQPRHFCKSCQRYWTAGGAMRNVPVGSGRRKNKCSSSASRYCQITVSEGGGGGGGGVYHPALKTDAMVLTFGGSDDHPLCESMASVLELAEKKALNPMSNGFHKVEQIVSVPVPVPVQIPCGSGKNGDDRSSVSSTTDSATTTSMDEAIRKPPQDRMTRSLNGLFASNNPLSCFRGINWPPCPWNTAVPLPAYCPSTIPVPLYPASYWNGNLPSCNFPWVSPVQNGNNTTPTLGKHSREENDSHSPDEAEKSSIWTTTTTTLGIKKEKVDCVSEAGFFRGFRSKSEEKAHKSDNCQVLKANPAALCRSICFQETA
ncbi:hypothetical protein Dimus_004910 [Dionaea muscipula]